MGVQLDLAPLNRFRDAIGDMKNTRAVAKGLKQWAEIYRAEMQERFSTFSRGGGDWAPLKPSTIRGRRKGKKKKVRGRATKSIGTAAILVDTGLLKNALDPSIPNAPGAFIKSIPFGVRVGYGGSASHPGTSKTIAEIAEIHQGGLGNNPVRKIIVHPNQKSMDRMARAMQTVLAEQWKEATR